ncbi:protein kilB [Kitasatospora sp. NPDC096147]|uniref:protein kilB n=1 Tax=Kitasatospora sp. NPDC096147 TaxID=3364093 RepID=UPI0037F9C5B5
MDTSIWVTIGTSAAAIIGALSGALLTAWLNGRASRSADTAAASNAHRTEVLAAVAELTSALADHRRAQTVRARVRSGHGAGRSSAPAATEEHTTAVHRTRSAVTSPSTTLRIICPELAGAAERAIGATYAIREARSLAEVERMRMRSKVVCDDLVAEAGRLLVRSH